MALVLMRATVRYQPQDVDGTASTLRLSRRCYVFIYMYSDLKVREHARKHVSSTGRWRKVQQVPVHVPSVQVLIELCTDAASAARLLSETRPSRRPLSLSLRVVRRAPYHQVLEVLVPVVECDACMFLEAPQLYTWGGSALT